MELHQLRYFVAVAEAGSVSRAATRCFVAQPSLSQQLRKLEEELGQPLFDRVGRGVVLNEAGRALLPRARAILEQVQDIHGGIEEDLESGRGPITVGAIPTMAPYVLPGVLRTFLRRFPDAELSIREDLTERLIEGVKDHTLDLALMSAPVEDARIDLEVLAEERLLVAVGRGRPLPDPERLRLADLRDQPTVVLHEVHCLGRQIQEFCSGRRMNQRIVCRGTQLETVLRLVGMDLGISLVPDMCAAADRSRLRRYVPIRRNGPTRAIALAWRRDRSRSQLARAFAEIVRAEIEGGKKVGAKENRRGRRPRR